MLNKIVYLTLIISAAMGSLQAMNVQEKSCSTQETAAHSTQVETKSAAAAILQQDPLALIMASQTGDLAQVKALIAAGARINMQNEFGNTALHKAARDGHLIVAQALIAAGAEINIQNIAGTTALFFAAWNCYLEVVKTLVDAGADIDANEINQLLNSDAVWRAINKSLKKRKWNHEF